MTKDPRIELVAFVSNVLAMACVGCASGRSTQTDAGDVGYDTSQGSGDADADADTDADADADADTDADADADTDADTDADADADTDADTDADADADTDADTDADADADTDADSDTDADADADTDSDRSAAELVARLSIGWNLGNSLDAPEGESTWGNPAVTPDLLETVAAAGFDVVRVPVTWSLHLGGPPDYIVDAAWMDRVEAVVGYVLDAGMIAIINLHHDGADGYDGVEWLTLNDPSGAVTDANNAAVEAKFTALWQQIATRFADHDQRLLFESMNEIHDGYGAPNPVYHDIINHLNQVFVDTVRSSGGNNPGRLLVVPGYNTNIEHTLAGFVPPSDIAPDRLILSVHYYDPWSFAGEGATQTWGAAYGTSDAWGQEDHVITQFDQLEARFVDAGIPVVIGEYGAVNPNGTNVYRRYYMEYVTKAAVDRDLLPIYWDNGGSGTGGDAFGLFDRDTGAILHPDILEAMLRAATADYGLEDIVTP